MFLPFVFSMGRNTMRGNKSASDKEVIANRINPVGKSSSNRPLLYSLQSCECHSAMPLVIPDWLEESTKTKAFTMIREFYGSYLCHSGAESGHEGPRQAVLSFGFVLAGGRVSFPPLIPRNSQSMRDQRMRKSRDLAHSKDTKKRNSTQ